MEKQIPIDIFIMSDCYIVSYSIRLQYLLQRVHENGITVMGDVFRSSELLVSNFDICFYLHEGIQLDSQLDKLNFLKQCFCDCNCYILLFTLYFRHVQLPKDLAKLVPKSHLMTEAEWRGLGVQQSQGWIHYMIHQPGNYLSS